MSKTPSEAGIRRQYYLAVRPEDGSSTSWGWKIMRRGMSMGIKLSGGGYRSYREAEMAGMLAIRDLVKALAGSEHESWSELASAERRLSIEDPLIASDDEGFLRRAFAIADRSRGNGNHPFGAILVDRAGTVLLEMENAVASGDATAHAERLLATEASRRFSAPALASSTLYSSAEPCAMCAGAIYWSGIGRVVYGLSERRLRDLTGNHPENPTLDLPCRTVFASGQRETVVEGPLLEDEAAEAHRGAWRQDG